MSTSTPWLSNSFTTSSQLDVDSAALSSLLQNTSLSSTSSELQSSGHFASFVTLVSGLEQSLHNEDPLFLDLDVSFNPNRTLIASGASSRVEKATWNSSNFKGKFNKRWGNSVALKFTRYHTDTHRTASNWKHLLSEVRALLHEPIRYHPNIVRLLGISWGATDEMRSNFPALVLELSELGTLAHLQMNESESLSFDVKKKLCWDVAKGISILHACGVVHGDLKHENVLVYPNRDSNATVKYVAKISDFGGSVMDLGVDQFRTLYTPTQLWLAPEFFVKSHMSEGELKLTDVYALGLLVWRTIIDGKNPYQHPVSNAEPMLESQIYELKSSNELISMAKESVLHHEPSIAPDGIQILHYIFNNTIQFAPSSRDLVRTIAALQVNKISETDEILENARKKNEEHNELLKNRVLVPGQHGLTQDGLGVYLAQTNATTGDYDYQHAGPGFRPTIRPPPQGEFRFEPLRLKAVLNWECQTMLIYDLEAAALIDLKGTDKPSAPTQMIPAIAGFHAFKCYCYEFGTKFDSVKACHWLKFTASCDVECLETNLARAWCWRFHKTFKLDLDIDSSKTLSWLRWAINRGHRKCISEGNSILRDLMPGSEMRAFHEKELLNSYRLLSTCGGGVGMPFFVPGQLRRLYHMDDFAALEQDIQTELIFRGVQSVDEIYVNSRGDGLLHMAAALGRLGTLKYLVETYRPNINKANSSREETPLVSACRGGHLACALYLLDLGATPEGDRFSLERPLWWLSSFKEDEIPRIAARLVMAGASLTFPQSPSEFSTLALSRGQLRSKYVRADYDNFLLLPASPLSRAVMMESLPAVRALLTLGAHPLEGYRDPKLKPNTGLSVCPMVVAAALTHSDILKVFLDHIDLRTARPIRLFSEIEILEMALDSKVTIGDPMSVDRRVARLGPGYQESLSSTLRMLHDREICFQQEDDEAKKQLVAKGSADMLYRLASVGQIDILRILLQLGHSARGYAEVFPIVAAVQSNNEPIFQLLVDYGADPTALYDFPSLRRKRTLLQVLAERPHNTIIGIGIAQALLEKGVPVDFVNPGGLEQESDLIVSRPAFSSAVLRQDFELADLCLKHGANVDLTYVHKANVAKITIFGELVCNPTEKNQDSLQFLLGLKVLPSYIVSPTIGWSVFFHASFFWATTDMRRRILGQMVRMIVAKDIYSSEEVMRYAPHAQVQAIGFPFVLALMGNLEVFTALLDCIPQISQNPHLYFEYEGVKLSLILRAIIVKFPELPEHISVANNNLGITNDKTMNQEWMERYKLILYRLEEIQQ